jgi:hypothetical protein
MDMKKETQDTKNGWGPSCYSNFLIEQSDSKFHTLLDAGYSKTDVCNSDWMI